jgi:5'-nucleotidase
MMAVEPGKTTGMRVLVTNDDGIRSEGLRMLADAARSGGFDVTVVAPSFDASGSSASMTAAARDGRVVVEPLDGTDGTTMLGVQGPPAFIVRAAMFGAFGPPPELVLSGVNRGLNTGRAILHSGTVGAALTAATYGRRALAISADFDPGAAWEPDGAVIAAAVGWTARVPEATVLNVNVPAAGRPARSGCPDGLVTARVRAARLAVAGTVQGRVSDADRGFDSVVFDDASGQSEDGTDSAVLAEGYVTVTAIRAVVEDDRLDLDDLIGL